MVVLIAIFPILIFLLYCVVDFVFKSMRFSSLMILSLMLLLNACSLSRSYVFPEKDSNNRNSNKVFQERRTPEYNPGGVKFYENQELFKQYMKDHNKDESSYNSNKNTLINDVSEDYQPNLADLYRKERERKMRERKIRPNLYDKINAYYKSNKDFLKGRDAFYKKRHDTDNFIVAGVDLKSLAGSYMPARDDIKHYNNMDSKSDDEFEAMIAEKTDSIARNADILDHYLIDDEEEVIVIDDNMNMNKNSTYNDMDEEDSFDDEESFNVLNDKSYW